MKTTGMTEDKFQLINEGLRAKDENIRFYHALFQELSIHEKREYVEMGLEKMFYWKFKYFRVPVKHGMLSRTAKPHVICVRYDMMLSDDHALNMLVTRNNNGFHDFNARWTLVKRDYRNEKLKRHTKLSKLIRSLVLRYKILSGVSAHDRNNKLHNMVRRFLYKIL